MKFDVKMWDIVTSDYDQLEYEDSLELITSAAFQEIWEKTEKDHELCGRVYVFRICTIDIPLNPTHTGTFP